jgi:hypothetical protein
MPNRYISFHSTKITFHTRILQPSWEADAGEGAPSLSNTGAIEGIILGEVLQSNLSLIQGEQKIIAFFIFPHYFPESSNLENECRPRKLVVAWTQIWRHRF